MRQSTEANWRVSFYSMSGVDTTITLLLFVCFGFGGFLFFVFCPPFLSVPSIFKGKIFSILTYSSMIRFKLWVYISTLFKLCILFLNPHLLFLFNMASANYWCPCIPFCFTCMWYWIPFEFHVCVMNYIWWGLSRIYHILLRSPPEWLRCWHIRN